MNDIQVIFGKNVVKYRKLKGYTQEQFSEMVGIDVSTLSNIERGISLPQPANLNKIIEALDVRPDMMFAESDFDIESIREDLDRRIELIKADEEKTEILYHIVKILT